MDSNVFLISQPAALALLCKIGIFIYARISGVANRLTRLYLYFLFALSIQNVAEISHFFTLARGGMPYLEFTVYYAAITAAIALLLHLALRLSFPENDPRVETVLKGVYLYGAALEILLLFTPWIIADLTKMGYTATRVPGPLFGMFELYAIGGFLGTLGILIRGMYRQETAPKRAKAAVMLLAIVPMAIVIVTVVVLLHLNVRLVNATVITPIAMTYFLVVTAYAIHQHRLFDIHFYLPWSTVRKRKTAFYARIQATIAEIAEMRSPRAILQLLADTLHCSVALVGGPRPVVAAVKHGLTSVSAAREVMSVEEFPREVLSKIEHILVAEEITEAMPDTYALMRRYHVGAIVPFHPHSDSAARWMLLGELFSEQVYTPLDFKAVEWLFECIGERYLDQTLLVRAQLKEALRDLRDLHRRLALAWEEKEEMRKKLGAAEAENQELRERNATLLRDRFTVVESAPAIVKDKTLDKYLSEYEAYLIQQTLTYCGGHRSEAAQLLGLRPNTLHYKMKRLGIDDAE